ncbi:MAG TPA: hypothetical protein DEA78_00015, partial [Cyanobacteria bacterium UBA11159]|nr:hypothetical protein [Cyanobacteria bacterium UBA11366]HBR72130.1 hypothetical protein [Cyanobacteria bacterium UBA11159]
MTWFTHSSRLLSLATALTLGLVLAVNILLPVKAESLSSKIPNQWEFTPPSGQTGNPLPENREGGGTRCGDCFADNNRDTVPIPLVPKSGVGTTSDREDEVWGVGYGVWGMVF